MKKLTALLCLGLLSITLISCGDEGSSVNPSESSGSEVQVDWTKDDKIAMTSAQLDPIPFPTMLGLREYTAFFDDEAYMFELFTSDGLVENDVTRYTEACVAEGYTKVENPTNYPDVVEFTSLYLELDDNDTQYINTYYSHGEFCIDAYAIKKKTSTGWVGNQIIANLLDEDMGFLTDKDIPEVSDTTKMVYYFTKVDGSASVKATITSQNKDVLTNYKDLLVSKSFVLQDSIYAPTRVDEKYDLYSLISSREVEEESYDYFIDVVLDKTCTNENGNYSFDLRISFDTDYKEVAFDF